jgi:hypothetical protein
MEKGWGFDEGGVVWEKNRKQVFKWKRDTLEGFLLDVSASK